MLSIIICILSFVITAVVGRFVIIWLRALKAGQSIREVGPTWHNYKAGTPTMGGIMFIFACLICLLLDIPAMRSGDFTYLACYGFALVFGVIGFLDDFIKVAKKRNLGLNEKQKMALQLVAAIAYLFLLKAMGHLTSSFYVPFFNVTISCPWVLYLIISVFIIVGTVNAVNITDGIDGLSGSVTAVVMLFFAVVGAMWGKNGASHLAAAVMGGLLGYLLYNHYPAKVFMGDTGSLFLGGIVCGLAFALDMPLILILVGIIYIAETMSDIIQVTYFKLTHGKRIFRMAPLHHHFEKGGWSENKIVLVFMGVTILFCILAWVGVMNRVI